MIKTILKLLPPILLLAGCSGNSPELGIENGKLKPCPNKPNCVSSQAKQSSHFIEPYKVYLPKTKAMAHISELLSSMARVTIVTKKENYIHAEFKSKIFRFVDDAEFYATESNGPETIIHIRSASRLGHSDLGVNRKRMEQIRKILKEKSK